MPFTEPPPPLPPPPTIWVDKDGRLTREAQDWLYRLVAYLKRLAAAIP